MKTLIYITLTLSLLATAVALKTVAKENFLRAGSRRLAEVEDTCDSIRKIICALQNTATFCQKVTELEKTNLMLSEGLSGATSYTVFAPTDEAFLNITEQLDQLSEKEIEEIILFHFNEGSVMTYEDLECTMTLQSLTGDSSRTKCRRKSQGVYAKHQRGLGNEKLDQFPRIDSKSKEACDGIIHRLDHVMLPSLYKPFKELVPDQKADPIIINEAEEEPDTGKGTGKDEIPPEETDNTVTTTPTNTGTTSGDGGLTKPDPDADNTTATIKEETSETKRIGALGINLIIFSTLLLCFVFVCMRR